MIIYYIYILVIFLSFLVYLFFYKTLATEEKIICFFLLTVFLVEIPAIYLSIHHRTNLILYNVGCQIQYIELIMYFNASLHYHRKNMVLRVGFLSLVSFLFVMFLFHATKEDFFIIFLLFEGFMITSLSLFTLFRIIVNDNLFFNAFKDYNFFVTLIILLFWCLTYFYWGFQHILVYNYMQTFKWVQIIIDVVDCGFYFSLGLILLLKKKNVFTN